MWQTAYFCVDCAEEMTWDQMMNSHGCCPYCGYKGPNADTVVDTYERSYKMVRIAPWWKLCAPQFKQIWKNNK